MVPDTTYDALAADLAALGRGLPEPAPGALLTAAVMERLAGVPTPLAPSRQQRLRRSVAEAVARRRRRAVLAVATAVALGLLVTPPVRAAVADWLGFAGVSVHLDLKPGPSVASPPPTVGITIALDEASDLVAFTPVLLRALGPPQGVQVTADRRLLSMSWTDEDAGVVRLDQFDGRLDFSFAKTAPGVQFTSVAGSFALWFDAPHEVVVLNADGTRRTETARLAGHTLIWERAGTTLRLEGDVGLARALEIAGSASKLP
jgi:hypothetical protein